MNYEKLTKEHFMGILRASSNPVLLVIDMQESSVNINREKNSLVAYQIEMIKRFKERNFKIIFTEFGRPLGSTVDDLSSLVSDYEEVKFLEKDEMPARVVLPYLKNVDGVFISGLYASECCLATANILMNAGKKVFTSTFAIADKNDKKSLNKSLKEYVRLGVVVL